MNAQNSLWRFSAFFLGAGLPLIMLGRAVTAVWLVLGVVIGFYALFSAGKTINWRQTLKQKEVLIVAAFLCASLIGAIFSIDTERAFNKLFELIGIGAGGFLIYMVYRYMPTKYVQYSLKVLTISTVVIALLLYLDTLTDDERIARTLYGKRWDDPYRLQPMSNYLAVLMPFAWVWFLKKRREYFELAKVVTVPLGILVFWSAFIAGGYNGWLAALVAMVTYLSLTGKWHGVVLHRKEWVFMPLVLIGGPLLYTVTERVALSDIFAQAQLYRAPFTDYLSLSLEGFFKNPLTGVGLNNFPYLYWQLEAPYVGSHQPQNAFVQVLTETGLLGFIPFVYFLRHVFKKLWLHAQLNVYAIAGLCSSFAFVAGSFFQANVFHAHWLVFWLFSVILSLRLCQPEAKS